MSPPPGEATRRPTLRSAGLALALAGLSLIVPAAASAQNEMTGIRAMGMGEAFTAYAAGDGALYHNPAGISSLMMYSIEAAYAHDTATGINTLHASVTDGKSNPRLGGGVGYTYSTSTREAVIPSFTGHDLYGALAFPAVPQLLLIGAGIHYMDYARQGDTYAQGITLDAGLLLALGQSFSIGAATRNILEVENSGRSLTQSFGVSYHAYGFQIGLDTVLDFGGEDLAVGWAAGSELLIANMVPIRVGYNRDGLADTHFISAGAGYRSELVGGDILFRQELGVDDRRMLGLALNFYL